MSTQNTLLSYSTSLEGVCDQKLIAACSSRKYLLYGFILGLVMHTNTTAWDQHWGSNETLKRVLMYVAWHA